MFTLNDEKMKNKFKIKEIITLFCYIGMCLVDVMIRVYHFVMVDWKWPNDDDPNRNNTFQSLLIKATYLIPVFLMTCIFSSLLFLLRRFFRLEYEINVCKLTCFFLLEISLTLINVLDYFINQDTMASTTSQASYKVKLFLNLIGIYPLL